MFSTSVHAGTALGVKVVTRIVEFIYIYIYDDHHHHRNHHHYYYRYHYYPASAKYAGEIFAFPTSVSSRILATAALAI